jgi:hypothetical protein
VCVCVCVFFLSLSGVVFVVVMQKVAACAMMIALCIMPSEISFLCMCFDSIYVDFVFTSFVCLFFFSNASLQCYCAFQTSICSSRLNPVNPKPVLSCRTVGAQRL